jgi:hypothetical protein
MAAFFAIDIAEFSRVDGSDRLALAYVSEYMCKSRSAAD